MATQSVENITARNVAIARAAYEAYVTKDRAALERLIAEDFHFTSPLDNRLDRETYFRRCWPNSKVIEGFDFIHLVTDADRVFVTYEGRNTDGRRFRNTEILTIRDQHIVDVVRLCAALKRAAAALAVRGRLPRSGKPSRLIPSLTLAPAASRDARGRQMSGAQMRRW